MYRGFSSQNCVVYQTQCTKAMPKIIQLPTIDSLETPDLAFVSAEYYYYNTSTENGSSNLLSVTVGELWSVAGNYYYIYETAYEIETS